jgi:acetoin utilization deacetylase AcuC-like enzyme
VRLYTHAACLAHDPGAGHPECPARLQAVLDAVTAAFPEVRIHDAPPASRAALERVHSPALVANVLDEPVHGQRRIDADTVLSPASPEAARRAAGAAIAAVDALLAGADTIAFCAVRPPGHHATAATAMGFCLFNSAAVAAAHALHAHGLQRVAIVDFDVHHGNGTQDIFAGEPRVFYASSHQSPLYPGTGRSDETGIAGNLANAPLPPGAGGREFRAVWETRLLPALDAFRPQLLIVSAGFDAHRLDPLADLALDGDDYHWLSVQLAALARRHSDGRVVSLLEGGYSVAALRECSVAHLRGLLDGQVG